METLRRLVAGEPALVGAVVSIVVAVGTLVGADLDESTVAAVLGAVLMLVGLVVRSRVSPVERA